MATDGYKQAVSEGNEFFVDVRVGWVAVRETAKAGPDHKGLSHDTPDVYLFMVRTGSHPEEESIKQAHAFCRRLNMKPKGEAMAKEMNFWEAARFASENPRRSVFAEVCGHRFELYFSDGELRHSSGGRVMTFTGSMLSATWHVVETEAERVKREHGKYKRALDRIAADTESMGDRLRHIASAALQD